MGGFVFLQGTCLWATHMKKRNALSKPLLRIWALNIKNQSISKVSNCQPHSRAVKDSLLPGAGQNIAMHASPTAKNFPCLIFIFHSTSFSADPLFTFLNAACS